MNNVVLKYLKSKGYNTVSTDYYNFVETWESWWKNQVDFHKYHDQTGKERKMFSLGMAKRLAEDWSSILFTERDEITTKANTDEQTEVNNEYLNNQLKILKIYRKIYLIRYFKRTACRKIRQTVPTFTLCLIRYELVWLYFLLRNRVY